MINTRINSIRHVHEEKEFLGIEEKDGLNVKELEENIKDLLKSNVTKEMIKEDVIPNLGFKFSTLPETIKSLLK